MKKRLSLFAVLSVILIAIVVIIVSRYERPVPTWQSTSYPQISFLNTIADRNIQLTHTQNLARFVTGQWREKTNIRLFSRGMPVPTPKRLSIVVNNEPQQSERFMYLSGGAPTLLVSLSDRFIADSDTLILTIGITDNLK